MDTNMPYLFLSIFWMGCFHSPFHFLICPDWKARCDWQAGYLIDHPSIFVGDDFVGNGISVVEAAARGRKAALRMTEWLTPEEK